MMSSKLIARIFILLCVFRGSLQIEMDRSMRIVGGAMARVGQFPHAAALILHLTGSRSSFCGGSIIHPNYVLTVSIKI